MPGDDPPIADSRASADARAAGAGTHDTAGGAAAPGRRRGRRPGGADTRTALLAAAREVFQETGFEKATVRAIARRANVDAAMVNHWFGGKQELFLAAIEVPINPAQVIESVVQGDPARVGERLATAFLTAWDGPASERLIAMARSAASHEAAARMLREFLGTMIFGALAKALRADHPRLRGSLCATQMIGLAMARYVVRIEPLATAPADVVAAAIGPNLQRYLTGDLDAAWALL